MDDTAKARSAPVAAHSRGALAIVLVAIVLGIAARGVMLSYAPAYSYAPDHVDFMAWAAECYENGPTKIYSKRTDASDPWLINYSFESPDGMAQILPRNVPHACNYPPLSTYIFAAQGWLWSQIDGHVVTSYLTSIPVTSRVANTHRARFVGALPSMLFDFLLAWGVAMLVRAVGGEKRPLREAVAFALTLLAPPIFLDSSFWNQVDSWIAALLVWCLVAMIRRRFILAGLVYGAALLIKPQAILFGPVIVFVLLALRFEPGGTWARMIGIAQLAATALITAFVLSLPHTLAVQPIVKPTVQFHMRIQARSDWLSRSYGETVFGDLYPRITLNAFNVWWFDCLRVVSAQDRDAAQGGTSKALDSTATAFSKGGWSSTKDTLGKTLLLGAVLLTLFLAARKWDWTAESWLAVAAMVMLAAFVLPTRVHERYIYLCLPFFIALALHRATWWIPLAPLLLVGTFEMTSFRWAGRLDDPQVRYFSAMLAVLSTFALLSAYLILVPKENVAESHDAKKGAASRAAP